MKNKELYENYISKLEKSLLEEKNDELDYILESIHTIWIPEEQMESINDILQEATLYIELKEEEYKNEALKLIEEFKKLIN